MTLTQIIILIVSMYAVFTVGVAVRMGRMGADYAVKMTAPIVLFLLVGTEVIHIVVTSWELLKYIVNRIKTIPATTDAIIVELVGGHLDEKRNRR